jgi:hypothetical protein
VIRLFFAPGFNAPGKRFYCLFVQKITGDQKRSILGVKAKLRLAQAWKIAKKTMETRQKWSFYTSTPVIDLVLSRINENGPK